MANLFLFSRKLFLVVLFVVAGLVSAITNPGPNQRDPLSATAFDQQHQQQPNYEQQHNHRHYQNNVDTNERLSSSPQNANNYNYNSKIQEHQQVQPIYERKPKQQQITSHLSDDENAITEYYTGCPPQHTGPLPYAYDCRRFLNCFRGRAHIQSCGPGTVFNPKTLECDRPDKVRCGATTALGAQSSTQPQPQRTGRILDVEPKCPVGVIGLHPHPTDCTKFLNCANGKTYIQNCAIGTAYSVTMMGCDYKEKVDCGERGFAGAEIAAVNDNNNRDEKSYPSHVADGAHLNQWGYNENKHQHNWQSQGTQQLPQHAAATTPTKTRKTSEQPNYRDRWSNMNMQRPAANPYGPQAMPNLPPDSSPTWSGQGTSVDRLAPNQNVLYVEGSLEPNRNYVHSIKSYSVPLAPFATPFASTTPMATTNIYYAQPVYESQETPTNPQFNTYNRRNHNKDISHSDSSNSWQPILKPPKESTPAYGSPTYPKSFTTPTSIYPHTVDVPNDRLMPPHATNMGQRPITEFQPQTRINLDELPIDGQFTITGFDQYPSGTQNVGSTLHDSSNLYGGLQPPQYSDPTSSRNPSSSTYPNHRPDYADGTSLPKPPEQSSYPNHKPNYFESTSTTPRTRTDTDRSFLQPPTRPTPPSNVNILQIYPPLANTSDSKNPRPPHYSPSYAGIAHSRNATWMGRKEPQPTDEQQEILDPQEELDLQYEYDNNEDEVDSFDSRKLPTTTERRGYMPPPYNRQFYTTPRYPNQQNVETTTLDDNSKLPISEAIRMLLRPYLDRSGTVDDRIAEQAESRIMSVINHPTSSTVIPTTSTIRTTTTLKPTTTSDQADVELIFAGEQHSLVNTVKIPTNSGTQATTNRHRQLPNPFHQNEQSIDNHQHHIRAHHHHHHPRHEYQHSPDIPRRHPNLPNSFTTMIDDDELPNPNAESTTPNTLIYADTGKSSSKGSYDSDNHCEYDCGNGNCIKMFEVCDGVNNCGSRKDESECQHLGYEVRLAGGARPHMGRIEIKILGKWGYVCDDKFGLRDADVVCKELGFKLGANEVRGNSFYAPEEVNFSYVMDEVECRGNETSLQECDFKGWGVHNCGPDEVVGVVCKVPQFKCPLDNWLCSTSNECIPQAFVCDNTLDCADKSDESEIVCNSTVEYRLEGGRNANEGRLEVKYRGQWGTICDDDFTIKEAQVACNSLGYYGRPKIEKNIFGPGNGPIWLDQVACFGNESSIDNCLHWSWGENNCNHTEDVGLVCTVGPPPRHSTSLHKVNVNSNDGSQEKMSEDEDIGLYGGQLERSSKFLSNQRRCGHFKDDVIDEYSHPEQRVINGTEARRGRHPWQATLRIRGRGGISNHWCGAVLISKKHLLTAAHCLAGYQKGAYFVRMGDHYANIAESSEIDSYIENWFIHEKFRDETRMNNDIALIVLKNPVRFNDYVQPICLPEKGAELKANRTCTISGFGSIQSGVSTPSNIMHAAQVPILPDDDCKQPHVYGNGITAGMFCAGSMDESVDTCQGDSGGPLVCSDDDGETLYGIISWGQHCGYHNKPGVYVRVEKYIDWIYDKINTSMKKPAAK